MSKRQLKSHIFLLFIPLLAVISCQSASSENGLLSIYLPTNEEKSTSLLYVEKHESQTLTSDIPFLISYPLKWKFVFVKYVIKEDLYNSLEKNKVILLPIGLSLSKSANGARPKSRINNQKNNSPSSNPYDSNNQEDPTTEVYRTIDYQTASYYFNFYSSFLLYTSRFESANNETILLNLDLHNWDTSEADLDKLKENVDYIATPSYLDSDLDLLPFDVYNEGKLSIQNFYLRFFTNGLDECPAFYAKYQKINEYLKDNEDTFETIKNKIKVNQ